MKHKHNSASRLTRQQKRFRGLRNQRHYYSGRSIRLGIELLESRQLLTVWGPWITFNTWDQLPSPYNDSTPIDPASNPAVHSVVGCVATAAAQIVEYWHYPSSIDFSVQNDAYVTKSRQIDVSSNAQAASLQFPTLAELDNRLATILYNQSDAEKANLGFGLGVKYNMDYTAGGSAAFTAQGESVFLNDLGYSSANWEEWSDDVKQRVIDNLKHAWPVIVDIYGPRTGGHSIVVDGYDDQTQQFHLNLGWNGQKDDWYSLPPVDLDYTVVRGAVFDIVPNNAWAQANGNAANTSSSAFPLPSVAARKWRVDLNAGGKSRPESVVSGMVSGNGRKLYFTTAPKSGTGDVELLVVDRYGTFEKSIVAFSGTFEEVGYPALTADGDVLIPLSTGRVVRVDPDTGNVNPNFFTANGQVDSVRVASDGDIYLNTSNTVYRITSTGSSTAYNVAQHYPNAQLALQQPLALYNGKVYFTFSQPAGTKNGTSIVRLHLSALNDSTLQEVAHTTLGDVAIGRLTPDAPMISPDGTIYLIAEQSGSDPLNRPRNTLYAINSSDLRVKWESSTGLGSARLNQKALGADGTIYMVTMDGDQTGWKDVVAIRPDGSLKWKTDLATGDYGGVWNLTVGSNGVVICLVRKQWKTSSTPEYYLYGIQDDGQSFTELFKQPTSLPDNPSKTYGGKPIAGGPNTIFFLSSYSFDSTYTKGEGIVAYGIVNASAIDGEGSDQLNNSAPSFVSYGGVPDNSASRGRTEQLSWTAKDDASTSSLQYTVLLNSLNDTQVLVKDSTSNTVQTGNLRPGTHYMWQVSASDGQAETMGPVYGFATKNPYDIDGNGVIRWGDRSFLYSHWGEQLGDARWNETLDFDGNGKVGWGDRSWLYSNWMRAWDAPANTYPQFLWGAGDGGLGGSGAGNSANGDGEGDAALKIDVEMVAVKSVSASDVVVKLPTAISQATIGSTFYVEIWVKNIDASTNVIQGGFVDMAYDKDKVTAGELNHGSLFVETNGGVIDAGRGLVDDFGGGVGPEEQTNVGVDQWARVGYVSYTATSAGVAVFTSGVPNDSLTFTRKDEGEIAWTDIELNSPLASVIIVTADAVAPTADLSAPRNAAWMQRQTLNDRKYLDFTFTDLGGSGMDPASILDTQPEFSLTGAAAAGVSLSTAAPTLMSGTTYRYGFTGSFGEGPVTVNFLANSFADLAGNANTSESESFAVDGTAPTADLTSPPSGGSIQSKTLNDRKYLEVVFADLGGSGIDHASIVDSQPEFSLNGTAAAGVTLSSAAPTLVSGATYRYAFTGSFGEGPVTVNFLANSITDVAGNPNTADSEDFTVLLDSAPPTADLWDPKNGGVIQHLTVNNRKYLDIVFSDLGGSGIDPASIVDSQPEFSLEGTAASGVTLSGAAPILVSGTTYRYAFTGSFGEGPVTVNFLAASFADLVGNANAAEAENFSVAKDPGISVAVSRGSSQPDLTKKGPIRFSVAFAEPVNDFATGDVTVTGTAPGILAAKVKKVGKTGTLYDVSVTGMTGSGTVVVGLAPNVAHNLAGVGNAASGTSSVTYDITKPTVTINQASGQSDPSNSTTLHFSVLFSEPVTDFTAKDVVLTGTASGKRVASVVPVGTDGRSYDVAVIGMTRAGTVIAKVKPSAALDAAGNKSVASTSSDNTVSYFVLSWSPIQNMATGRHEAAVTVGPDDRPWVIAGATSGANGGFTPSSSTAVYYSESGTWKENSVPLLNTARGSAKAVTDSRDNVWVIGGHNVSAGGILATVEQLSPSNSQWVVQSNALNTPRGDMGIAIEPDDTIIVFGGSASSGATRTAEKRDPATGLWTYIAPMNEKRYSLAYASDSRGYVYAIGGADGVNILSTVERYDPTRNVWEYVTSLPQARMNGSAFVLNGEVWHVGGWAERVTPDTYIYNPQTNKWRTGPVMYEGFVSAHPAVTPSGIYLAGGQRSPGGAASTHVALLATTSGQVLYSTDFSTAPGWTTDDPAKLQADSASGTFHGTQVNTEGTYAFKQVSGFNPNQSWELTWDARINNCDWSAGLSFGLLDSTLSWPGSAFVDLGVVDGGRPTSLYPGQGKPAQSTYSPAWNPGTWYHYQLKYDSSTDVLQFQVYERATGTALLTLTSNVAMFPADMNRIGVTRVFIKNTGPGASPSATVDYNLDNIVLRQFAGTM